MRQKLIYNLGRRGFFSEINNLVIAKIFAEDHNWDFEVNSFYWNCKYTKGLKDYFNTDLPENNRLCSAQMLRKKTLSFDLHSLFYLGIGILNAAYRALHTNVVWGSEVYESIRAPFYLNHIDTDRFLNDLRQLLQMNDTLRHTFQNRMAQLGIQMPFLGVHIRRGDKITTGEMQNIPLLKYVEAIIETGYKHIYIATDDYRSVEFVHAQLPAPDYHIYCNPELAGAGFSEGRFNHSSKKDRYKETCSLLFDIFVLFRAAYFIGTYSSNLSRVIPCALGLNNCKSLDVNWFI